MSKWLYMPKVIWSRPALGRYGNTVQLVEVTLIAVDEEWCTVELENGEQFSAKTADVKLAKAISA